MSDNVGDRLREGLHSRSLPGAPETLRDFLAELPRRGEPPNRTRRISRGVVLGAAATLAVATAIGAALLGAAGFGRYADRLTSLPPGYRAFEAPGISFYYPADWRANTTLSSDPGQLGLRQVVELTGLPGGENVWITEQTDALPGPPGPHPVIVAWTPTTIAGRPAWIGPDDSNWAISAPDGGLYMVEPSGPVSQSSRDELENVLRSLKLSAVEHASPSVVNGHVHVELPQGFSFDYPAGWSIYYPQDSATMSSSVVTVASGPLEPPCSNDTCQRFTTPPGTVAIEFIVGEGPEAPDWSAATMSVGGQPASRADWGTPNATVADEGHSWSVRLTNRTTLGILASLRGPNLPALRAVMDEVVVSVRISTPESPAP